MVKLNTIYNEDCLITMDNMIKDKLKIDLVLTSPPYNTARTCKTERSINNYENRYDIHFDKMNLDDYILWTKTIFNTYDKILKLNGCILYNMSYGNENPNIIWLTIAEIIKNTNFMIADVITWRKSTALPNNVSSNKLTRITELIFVICRKNEYKTFFMNKKVKSISRTGQKYYENIYNYIEAKNNDGSCKLNKATFSSELCEKLLNLYGFENCIVYDNFFGTGTTGVACKKLHMNFIGSEISKQQCAYAFDRIFNNK